MRRNVLLIAPYIVWATFFRLSKIVFVVLMLFYSKLSALLSFSQICVNINSEQWSRSSNEEAVFELAISLWNNPLDSKLADTIQDYWAMLFHISACNV